MIGWLDCGYGASGDMLLAVLLDAGVPEQVITDAVAAVTPEPVAITAEPTRRGGFAATRAHVRIEDSETRRTWADIRKLLDRADLDDTVRRRASSVFQRLAEAEADAHGTTADEVHFHEVGALDAIADVVGVCAGFTHLALDRLVASPVALGGGRVRTEHGSLTVPAPAVSLLLRGVPTYGGPVDVELCTPTGAALLREWVDEYGPQPEMTTATVAVGAGGRDLAGHANVVRLLLGSAAAASTPQPEPAVVLATNVDDLDPRIWPTVIEALFAAGASDAWLTPILMKKGRPAHTLSVLAPADRVDELRSVLFRETSTIGLREQPVTKHALERTETTIRVGGHDIRVKVAVHGGEVTNVQPEYDDVAAASAALGRPVKVVLADAAARARELWSDRREG